MRTPHPIGSLPSMLRTICGQLGSTIREQAEMLGMPHATLGRRLDRPEEFTIAEALKLAQVVSDQSATTYTLRLESRGKRQATPTPR